MAGRLSNEEKLELMLEYTRVTGEKIKAHTEYKGYQIGHIRNNLRQAYFNGTLKMDEALLKRFIENGIINEKKERKKKATTKEKYDFLMKLAGKSESAIQKATMENGLPFTTVRNSLQAKYNNGELDLTEEQIANLMSAGFLNYSKEEQAEAMRKYGIPARYVQDAVRKYGSYEEFLIKYKNKEVDYTFGDDIFSGARCVVLSEENVPAIQKLAYYNLIKVLRENVHGEPLAYIDIDELENVLAEHLSIRENQIIKLRFEFDGKRHSLEDCVKILGITLTKVRQIEQSAMSKLLSSSTIQKFFGFGKKDEEELEKYKTEYNDIEGYIKDFNAIRKFITDEEGNLKNEIPNVKLSEIGVSGKIFADGVVEDKTIQDLINSAKQNRTVISEETLKTPIETLGLSEHLISGLRQNGLYTIADITQISEQELLKKKHLGANSAKEIITLLRSKGISLKISEEEKARDKKEALENILNVCNIKLDEYISKRLKIWENMDRLTEVVRRYKIAYDNYINKENLFNREEIIPAVHSKNLRNVKKVALEELLTERIKTSSERGEIVGNGENVEDKAQKILGTIDDENAKPQQVEIDSGCLEQQVGLKIDVQTSEEAILEQGQTEEGTMGKSIKLDETEELSEMIDEALATETVDDIPDKLPEIAKIIEIGPNSSQEQAEKDEIKQLEQDIKTGVATMSGGIDNPDTLSDEEELDAWIEGIVKAEKIKEAASSIPTEGLALEDTDGLSVEMLEEQKMRRALLNSIKDSQQELNELKEQLAKFGIEGDMIDE